ncbi:hypothetical protein, variant 1 [Aphanomyces invadans]|uniref:Uncharacterized protein n=1 Tax=Aphanomyces invadans TaxID=157072 RepID=A0A024UED8_9STRA|nr:hypothetical protein, variant 1 [Aphanomyces invadans]ETW04639.1 hypothetical protein, variant 1 [Aphanomyces invadans]|eukprot:XP_008866076.1 hypothetical protein, variant 1 [Aphanomyces invadans]
MPHFPEENRTRPRHGMSAQTRLGINLGQVEDELRAAEAYLITPTALDKSATNLTMTEARRKEILAKLNAERTAMRQRKADGQQIDAVASSSFLNSTAFFPLPSLSAKPEFDSLDIHDADDAFESKRCHRDDGDAHRAFGSDDDDSLTFLKELQHADGDDTLFFASDIHQLPPPPSTEHAHLSFDRCSILSESSSQQHVDSFPLSTPSLASNAERSATAPAHPSRPPKKSVRYDGDLESTDRPVSARQPETSIISPSSAETTSTQAKAPTKRPSSRKLRAEVTNPSPTNPFILRLSEPVASASHVRHALSRTSAAQQKKRMEQLAQSVDYTVREKAKVAQDMAAFTTSCSFLPNSRGPLPRGHPTLRTPEKATKSAKTAKPPPSWSPHKKAKLDELTERLHGEGSLRFELREKVKQVLDDQHMRATCTFKPQINRNRSAVGATTAQKPIHTRLPELHRHKKEMLRQLEHAIEAETQLTFTPTINPHSQKLAHDLSKIDVTARLVQDAEESAEKKLQIQAYYAALDEPAFTPCVNDRSQAIVERKPEFKLDFVTRQQLLQAQLEQKFEAKLALEERVQAEEKPFQPCIGNSNQVLQFTRPKRLVESKQAQLYRMTYEEPRQRELAKKRLEDEKYEKFSHKPVLNKVSKALGQPTSIHKLAQKPSTKTIRSRVVRDMDAQEQAECRFRPALVAADPDLDRTSVWNPETCLQQIEQARIMRRQKLEDQRNSLEFQELQACTFAPAINRPTPRPSRAPVVVRGLGRFLELKQLAKRQEAELKYVVSACRGTSSLWSIPESAKPKLSPTHGTSLLGRIPCPNHSICRTISVAALAKSR